MGKLFLLLSLATFSAFAQEEIKPIHYWNLDENDGTILLDSAGKKNGELSSYNKAALPVRIAGAKGKALDFKQNIRSGASFGKVKLPKDFTMMCYYKPDFEKRFLILHEMDGANTKLKAGFMLMKWWKGQISFEVTGKDGEHHILLTPKWVVKENKAPWYHIAVTKDAKVIKIYVNGVVKAEKKLDKDFTMKMPKYRTLMAGRHPYRFGYPYSGAIDEIKIFDKALAKEQILKECAVENDDE